MSGRVCVICGEEPPLKDQQGNEAYAYPKTTEEARIWQASMAAKNCCLESIQKQCCVCVEHIPDFVKRAKKIGRRLKNFEREKDQPLKEKATAEAAVGCQCPDKGEPGLERPSVNVLLLNGASLPTYCGQGQPCADLGSQPGKEGNSEVKKTKRLNPKESDTEIFVQESEFKDTGGTFPDIDGTEVTRLRTPMQEEEQLEKIQKALRDAEQEKDPSVRKCRNSCLPGCTDVLLLGRGHHPTDECPCKCDQCTRPPALPENGEPCCQPECCEDYQPEYFTQPPCGCECEQQVRRELTKVIKSQAQKIRELEKMLCRQNNLRNCLQKKLDELYCEFGRLDEDADNRSRLSCPDSDRGAPDCYSVLHPPPPPPPPEPEIVIHERRKTKQNRKITVMKANREMELSKQKEEPLAEERGERVHWFAERKKDTDKRTNIPLWTQRREAEKIDSGSKISIRFGQNNTYIVPVENDSLSTYSLSNSRHSKHSSSSVSMSNRSRT
ncbi:uncharacterized protein LOC108095422 [Drosophila ficusphila]|uniref:uncharacterized protein LOC108095422 n=1 Tax=Drosophila ficusphila TaxID=30025 RepID=UPI0007E79D95|nr:uncharacterized protein LOC108095422 [Drosophila ficusphila]